MARYNVIRNRYRGYHARNGRRSNSYSRGNRAPRATRQGGRFAHTGCQVNRAAAALALVLVFAPSAFARGGGGHGGHGKANHSAHSARGPKYRPRKRRTGKPLPEKSITGGYSTCHFWQRNCKGKSTGKLVLGN